MKRLAIFAALAIVPLVAAAPAILQRSTLGAVAGHRQSWTRYEASQSCCDNFTDLVKRSVVVVRARIVATTPSRLLPYEKSVLVMHPSAQLTGSKATAVASAPTPPPYTGPTGPAEPGIVVTDSSISVSEVLKGTSVQPGQVLTVTQLGGTDPQGKLVLNQEDPLFQVGQEEVLFLLKDFDGKYSTLGGLQARFAVGMTNTVQPLDTGDYPYTQAYTGLTVTALKAAIQAVQ